MLLTNFESFFKVSCFPDPSSRRDKVPGLNPSIFEFDNGFE